MKHLAELLLLFLGICSSAWAQKHELFKGEAKENGKLVYIENHDVTFDEAGKATEAKTTYVDPNGKILGILSSDFRKSMSMPEHLFLDERTKGKYGIRRSGGKIILFNQDFGKEEETTEIADEENKDRIQVGCQGFNYFLKGKLDEIIKIKDLPVLFMVPGDLSTYKFLLEFVRENLDQTVEFKVKIENWLLRMFAPQLEFRYDRKIDRIVWYRGISNIKNERGKVMNVTIDYKF